MLRIQVYFFDTLPYPVSSKLFLIFGLFCMELLRYGLAIMGLLE